MRFTEQYTLRVCIQKPAGMTDVTTYEVVIRTVPYDRYVTLFVRQAEMTSQNHVDTNISSINVNLMHTYRTHR